MSVSDDYIFGTHTHEIGRLGQQHRLWSAVCSAHWQRAGFCPGHTLLDMGCGPGFAAADLAEFAGPKGRVIAVEPAQDYATYFREALDRRGPYLGARVDLRVQSAEQMELGTESLDGAYARWVFTFIADPRPVLDKVYAALKPGACLALMDYAGWASVAWGPRTETLATIRKGVLATYTDFGSDSEVGLKLPSGLVKAGFEMVEMKPLLRIARPQDALWHWPQDWFESFLPTVVAHGHLSEADIVAWRQEWQANAADPAGFFMTPAQVLIIAAKPNL